MVERLRVAVLFGGKSPEHDVSIVSGLQALQALDSERFAGIPVYVAPDGQWLVGKKLLDQGFYVPNAESRAECDVVSGPVRQGDGQAVLRSTKPKLFGRPQEVAFDVALPAFHGGAGENGQIQGLLEVVGVPYTGMRHFGCSVAMDKIATKRLLSACDISTLPFVELKRPVEDRFLTRDALERAIAEIGLPCIVKPTHLGSSIGVSRIDAVDDLEAVLPSIFSLDSSALLEKLVSNLVEYNLAVRAVDGRPATSAIESPLSGGELLDFRKKYLSASTGSVKALGSTNAGLITMTRSINPDMEVQIERAIREQASLAFDVLGMAGAPRIDFLCDSLSGEVWLNEVNPCPGSFAYFLWSAAERSTLFTDFLSALIDEGIAYHRMAANQDDLVPADARLFKRH